MSKTVLVTGGAGFIAHHVIENLLRTTDWNIVSLDRLDFSGNLNRLWDMAQEVDPDVRKRLKVVFHDLRAELNPMIINQLGDINYVLHLAAGSHVDRSIEFPMEFVWDNVVGTGHILEYARKLKNLERFVYFSTDEVFGPAPAGVNYGERDRYNSSNPYSATKAGGEELAVAFQNTYSMPISITHTMNIWGPRQHPEKFIPMCIKKIRDGEYITIHSDISKTIPGSRHYLHVSEVGSALLFILNQPYNTSVFDYGGANCPKFNIVGSEEINNLQVAQLIAEIQGKELHYDMLDFHSARPGHDLRYALSGDYMKSLGWQPSISMRERMEQLIEWSFANPQWLNS